MARPTIALATGALNNSSAPVRTRSKQKAFRVKRDEMERHVRQIADAHMIAVWHCRRPSNSIAIREGDEVHIPAIKSEISYAVAMHELGHLLGRHQSSVKVYTRERWAWSWAKRNSLCWTTRMERYAEQSLEWYAHSNA